MIAFAENCTLKTCPENWEIWTLEISPFYRAQVKILSKPNDGRSDGIQQQIHPSENAADKRIFLMIFFLFCMKNRKIWEAKRNHHIDQTFCFQLFIITSSFFPFSQKVVYNWN